MGRALGWMWGGWRGRGSFGGSRSRGRRGRCRTRRTRRRSIRCESCQWRNALLWISFRCSRHLGMALRDLERSERVTCRPYASRSRCHYHLGRLQLRGFVLREGEENDSILSASLSSPRATCPVQVRVGKMARDSVHSQQSDGRIRALPQ